MPGRRDVDTAVSGTTDVGAGPCARLSFSFPGSRLGMPVFRALPGLVGFPRDAGLRHPKTNRHFAATVIRIRTLVSVAK